MKIVPVEQRNAAENVRDQLIELINTRQLTVNEQLPSEAELAQSFGVSRSVIREALQSLKALGLTRSYAGKGTFVSATQAQSQLLSGRYLPSQLNEVRVALEVPAARLAAERRTDADVDELETLVDLFEAAEDAAERVQIDARFHIAIAKATGNPLFEHLIEGLRTVMQEQALAVAALPGRAAVVRAEHRSVYEAIAAGDSDAAGDALQHHLDAVILSSDQLSSEHSPA